MVRQGTDVEVFASQPGLVQTELNGRKLDHRKLSAISVDISAKIIGKDARTASLCLQRPATDPTVSGAAFGPLSWRMQLCHKGADIIGPCHCMLMEVFVGSLGGGVKAF